MTIRELVDIAGLIDATTSKGEPYLAALHDAGYDTASDVRNAPEAELLAFCGKAFHVRRLQRALSEMSAGPLTGI